MRHLGWGHLRPAFLLCLRDVRRWRCRLDLASCGLPLNFLEHAGQLATEVVGVLGVGDVGEMVEAGDRMVSEVGRVLTSDIVVQDMALVGEESRVQGPLLIEDQGAGETRFGCSGLIISIFS